MNSWYDIMGDGKYDESQIAMSARRVLKTIDAEAKAFNNDYSKVFLGGFS